MSKKFWIKDAIHKPGSLHKQLGIPMGHPIPVSVLEKAMHKKGKMGQRARLAMTLRKMHHAS